MTVTSFEVASIFRVIDEASPQLRKILAQVRELNKVVNQARENLAKIGSVPGMATSIAEAGNLAKVWGDVAKAADAARAAIGRVPSASSRSTAASLGAGGRSPSWPGRHGGGSGGFRGGGHAGLVTGGLMADAIYQGAELQKEAFLTWWHSGLSNTPGSSQTIRDLIQNATATSGFSFKDVGEASEDIFRLMKGTKNNGLDAAPELLRAGATEALIKGTGLKESVKSLVEMAHMMGVYEPDQLKSMAPVIGFLSTLNPASLPQFGRSASYSVPTLSNALGINAADVLFANTSIARAGATGSKSGTWVEHAFDRALPPDPNSMGGPAYGRRMWALRMAGLIDANDKSTILGANGGIDIEKFLDTARSSLEKLPLATRNSVEKAVFGEQGARGYELMTSPAVMEQMRRLKAEMPDFVPKYNAFLGQYGDQSTIQKARTTYAEFNNLLSDIGDKVLPAVNLGLSQFDNILKSMEKWLPKSSSSEGPKAVDTVLNRAMWGAGIGAGIGAFGGGVGALPGALIGGVTGGMFGVAEQYMANNKGAAVDRFGREVVVTGNSAAQAAEGMKALGDAIRGLPAGRGSVFPGGTSRMAPISLSINMDGRLLARAMGEQAESEAGFSTSAAASDGLGIYDGGGQ